MFVGSHDKPSEYSYILMSKLLTFQLVARALATNLSWFFSLLGILACPGQYINLFLFIHYGSSFTTQLCCIQPPDVVLQVPNYCEIDCMHG